VLSPVVSDDRRVEFIVEEISGDRRLNGGGLKLLAK
jgi:hypothetical protein